MKSTSFALLFIGPLLVASCSRPPEPAAAGQLPPIDVTTARVAVADVPSGFETGGIVEARNTAVVASRVMGAVAAVRVRAGERVRRGALLVELDAREMQANRDRSHASAAAAEQAAVAADEDLAASRAQLALAQATHGRIADLAAKKSATAQELDQATAALRAAEAQVRSAEARRAAARSGTDAAHAATTAAETSLSYTQVVAPFDAVVSERAVDAGSMVMPGAKLLLLEDTSAFRVVATVDEARAATIAIGDSADVVLTSDAPDRQARHVDARVAELARVDPSSHAFVVKLDLPADATVRPGSYVRVTFAGPARRALAIPAQALVQRGQLSFVFAVDTAGVARLRAISPGQAAGDRLEVLAGVADGDTLVVNPPPALADGRRVPSATSVAQGERR